MQQKPMSAEALYNAQLTIDDLTKDIALDPKHFRLLTYSKPKDECDGIEIQLGNQAGGFPFTCLGHEWKGVEFLYLCGEWSWQGEDAVAIQRDVLTAKSGYAARRFKKAKYANSVRPDYAAFRHHWMLWCVWQKCIGNDEFRNHLLSMPDDRIIVEVVKRDKVWAAWPDADGIFHGANAMGKILTLCRQSLKQGTTPAIDSRLLNERGIYILGQRVQF